MKISIGGREFDATPGTDRVTVDGKDYGVSVRWDHKVPIISVDGLPFRVELPEERGSEMTVIIDHRPVQIRATGAVRARPARRPPAKAAARGAPPATAKGAVLAGMTGAIVEVHVKLGDHVNEGDILVILEAMKMRNEIVAPHTGIVKAVEVEVGSRVSQGDVLVVLGAGD